MSKSEQKGNKGALIFMIIWGIGFVGIPMVILVISALQMKRELGSRDWNETPCKIEKIGVEVDKGSSSPFTPECEFSYTVEGVSYDSAAFNVNERSYSDYTEAWLKIKDLRHKKEAMCYVNPADPNEVKLQHDEIWTTVAGMIFCVLFIVIGLVVVVIVVKNFWKKSSTPRARSDGGMAFFKRVGLLIVGIVFLFAGAVTLLISVNLKLNAEQIITDWKQVPCEIIYSKINTNTSRDSSSNSSGDTVTYSLDVFYQYQFEGETYRSNVFGGGNSSDSNYKNKQIQQREYAPGTEHGCYVNPHEPWYAILAPEKKRTTLLVAIIVGAVFCMLGLILVIIGWKKRKKALSIKKKMHAHRHHLAADEISKREIEIGKSRLMAVLFSFIFSCVWNGFISLFLIKMLEDSGPSVWFMIPFILVGIGSFILTLYLLVRVFSPRVSCTLYNDGCCVGDTLKIEWRADLQKFKSLQIELHCEQSAMRTSGNNTQTVTQLSERVVLLDGAENLAMHRDQGLATVKIPSSAMHSWEANNSSIVWKIVCIGQVKILPNIKDESLITINPRKAATHG